MEAHSTATLSDVTPTSSQTQVITPDEIPAQVIKCLDIHLSFERNGFISA